MYEGYSSTVRRTFTGDIRDLTPHARLPFYVRRHLLPLVGGFSRILHGKAMGTQGPGTPHRGPSRGADGEGRGRHACEGERREMLGLGLH